MEKWRQIAHADEGYEVSTYGRVRRDGNLRSVTPNSKGYMRATIKVGGKFKTRQVHVMVLETFVGDRPPGHETRHIDNDKSNNKVTNLCWGTHSENMRDKLRAGHNTNANKTRCPQDHSYDDAYTYIDKNGHVRRICRTCQRARTAANRARKRAQA